MHRSRLGRRGPHGARVKVNAPQKTPPPPFTLAALKRRERARKRAHTRARTRAARAQQARDSVGRSSSSSTTQQRSPKRRWPPLPANTARIRVGARTTDSMTEQSPPWRPAAILLRHALSLLLSLLPSCPPLSHRTRRRELNLLSHTRTYTR